ncbi:MAG TPA: nucleotide sugar dehydrogenase [Candidatus Hypogeohydataceae bacterium YC41]
MNHLKTLHSRVDSRAATVGIIGLGHVGLPLVLRFCQEGFNVVGFDIDDAKVASLNKGESYIQDVPSESLAGFVGIKFSATADFNKLSNMDVIIICVPTPLTNKKDPDLRYIISTTEEIAKRLRAGQLISLESSTYPGNTEEELLPRFESKGLKVGKDFFLVYSPERVDPGNKQFKIKNIPKIVGGVTPNCLSIGKAVYEKVVEKVVTVSSPKVAEMAKLLENIYRSVNIALVNELKVLCDRMDINIWEVIEAASTKPFGFVPFYPGPGLGGHCIPVDPFYLSWKAREYNIPTRFIELAGEINTSMPHWVIDKVIDALNERGKTLKGSKILILGVTYKKDVADMRESPALKLIELLSERDAIVTYNDPYIRSMPKLRKYDFRMDSQELTSELLKSVDAVIIAADHGCYDFDFIVSNANLVIDTRNAIKNPMDGKVIKA